MKEQQKALERCYKAVREANRPQEMSPSVEEPEEEEKVAEVVCVPSQKLFALRCFRSISEVEAQIDKAREHLQAAIGSLTLATRDFKF